jgi:uncharacterized membrane protein
MGLFESTTAHRAFSGCQCNLVMMMMMMMMMMMRRRRRSRKCSRYMLVTELCDVFTVDALFA